MIAFSVKMVQEFVNAVPQRIFAEENHLFQTLFLDASYKTLRVGVQIWGCEWRIPEIMLQSVSDRAHDNASASGRRRTLVTPVRHQALAGVPPNPSAYD